RHRPAVPLAAGARHSHREPRRRGRGASATGGVARVLTSLPVPGLSYRRLGVGRSVPPRGVRRRSGALGPQPDAGAWGRCRRSGATGQGRRTGGRPRVAAGGEPIRRTSQVDASPDSAVGTGGGTRRLLSKLATVVTSSVPTITTRESQIGTSGMPCRPSPSL